VLDRLRYRFAIGDLGVALLRGDLEVADYARDQHIEVQFAHARDDDLPRLLVLSRREGRILFRENLESLLSLSRSDNRLGFDGDRDHRLGEVHFFQEKWPALGAHRVALWASFMPTIAAMSPALTSSMGSDLLACMRRRRVMRSRFFLFWL
jgi:hypothetical protein